MKKVKILFTVVLVCLFSCLFSVTLQAASYQKLHTEKQKIGKYYMRVDRNGFLTISQSEYGTEKRIASDYPRAVSDGKKIYYGIYQYQNDALKVYCYTINSEKLVYLDTIKHAESVCGFYDGKLYIERHEAGKYECDYMFIHTYSYNVKNGKLKRVMKGIAAGESYGRYLVGMPNSGAAIELPLKVYDAKTGKIKTISSKALSYARYGKYIYYVQANKTISRGWNARVYQYNLTTGKKKALGKSIKTQGIYSITKNYMQYYNTSGRVKKVSY